MASSTADQDRPREKMCSSPSRRVRIIGKIRGFTDQESESLSPDTKCWITIHKPQDVASSENKVKISFLDQAVSRKDASYELDYCYEQDEEMKMIYSREIKPLISDILGGKSASVIAYGAKGSGKTFTIQGTQKKPGLAVMALSELLPKAEETKKSVSLSLCEVYQEHVYDLLDSNHSEVQVLEDARGKINLKGLSQVSLKSISEIQKIYLSSSSFGKSAQKMPLEQPKRTHKVMIINVSDNSNCKLVGKMNFVDLAGYVDARRSSTDGSTLTETTRINKSLNAVFNVVYALNTNENHVPYRESKLTQLLKESLAGRNHVLILTCMNPHFCQDTVHTLSLASRSCKSINHVSTNFELKTKISARPQVLSSQKFVKPATAPVFVKKQVASSLQFSATKSSAMLRGRVLFDNGKKLTSNQAKFAKDADSVKMLELHHESDSISISSSIQAKYAKGAHSVKMLEPHESNSNSIVAETQSQVKEALAGQPIPDDSTLALVPCNQFVLEDKSIVNYTLVEGLEEVNTSADNKSNKLEATPLVTRDIISPLENDGTEKQDKCLQKIDKASPPLSERLREISNNLKLFCSATPLRVKMPEEVDKQHSAGMAFTDNLEPKTPTAENSIRFSEKHEKITQYCSPWEKFSQRSSGMKNSLVDDCLEFLNTASKEELKRLKGIGEKRATFILELREESPEPFKRLEDLEDIGLSAKQIKGMMKKVAGELFG